jgi:hypothetical protein
MKFPLIKIPPRVVVFLVQTYRRIRYKPICYKKMKCEFISETEVRVVLNILKTVITQVPVHTYTLRHGTRKNRFTHIIYKRIRVSSGLHVYFTTGYE